MPRARRVVLALLTLILLGSIALTGGVALYLRSPFYRQSCAQALRDQLGLESEIGRVVPRSRSASEFRDIIIWLPDRRGKALVCQSALLRQTPVSGDPHAYEIDIFGGECEISTDTWLASDFRGLLESSLRPGFSPDGPRRVSFENMDISFQAGSFRLEMQDAAGRVDFISRELATATVYCRVLNGQPMSDAVLLLARFSPANGGVRMDHLELVTPEAPLRHIGLDALVGAPVDCGTFQGRVVYEEETSDRVLTLSGICRDLDLAEWTRAWFPRAWRGRSPQIELQELRIVNGAPRRLRFRGALADVEVSDALAAWGYETIGGTIDLSVGVADLSPDGIERLVASGRYDGVSLEALTDTIGWGRMSGVLRTRIADLTIENNRIRALNASLLVDDAGDEPNWIEGKLLRELASRVLQFRLPPMLPERVPYSKVGVRLDVRDEELRVHGGHGHNETTILTLRLLGRDLPTVFEPARSFDLSPHLDELRRQARERLQTIPWPTPIAEPQP